MLNLVSLFIDFFSQQTQQLETSVMAKVHSISDSHTKGLVFHAPFQNIRLNLLLCRIVENVNIIIFFFPKFFFPLIAILRYGAETAQ